MRVTVGILLFLLVPLSFISAQTDSEMEGRRKMLRFERDAARLVLRHLAEEEAPLELLPIEIDAELYEEMIFALTTLRLQEGIPQTPWKKYNIRTLNHPQVKTISILADKSHFKGGTESRLKLQHKEIEKLLEKYGMRVSRILPWNDTHHQLTLESIKPLNMKRVESEILMHGGFKPMNTWNNTNWSDIRAEKTTEGWTFNFLLTWKAEDKSEIQTHIWSYHVDLIEVDRPVATFLKEYGDPLPPQ